MGECMYILLTTLFYTTFIVIVSTAVVLPVATFGDSWGGVLRDFVYGNGELYAMDLNRLYNMSLVGPSAAMSRLYPVGAQMYSFFMVWASFFLLGLIQYLVSLTSKSMFLGFVTAGVFVFLDPIMYRMSAALDYRWLNYFSLITWVDINDLYMHGGKKSVVTIPYMISVYVILILLLLWVIWRVSKKIIIEVRGEV